MTKNIQKHMKLSAFFLPCGHHVAAWKHSKAQQNGGLNLNHYIEVAKIAENGKFDMIFSQIR